MLPAAGHALRARENQNNARGHDTGVYDVGTYGRSFADVYDEWYHDISDITATVDRVAALAGEGLVLELGIGTGRIAVPLTRRGTRCAGIDASPEMLARLNTKPDAALLLTVLGDMAALPFRRRFAVVLSAFNTLFNLPCLGSMARAIDGAARVLVPGGALVVEAFVPPAPGESRDVDVSVRERSESFAVITTASRDHDAQVITGHHVQFDRSGLRLRPWRVCYATVEQLDLLAQSAGLALESRHAGWKGEPFDDDAVTHVSIYRAP